MEKTRVELNEDNIENQKEEMGNVEDKVEDPKMGMMFNSINELMKFYTRYAKEKGFAVAKRTSKKGDDGEVRAVLCTDGRWVLNSIELDHNHGLSPRRSRFYKCHRILQPHATRKLELNDRAEPLSVIDSSVSLNDGRRVRISYKGVPGAYSEDAALKAYSQCETVPYNKFEDAFKVDYDVTLTACGQNLGHHTEFAVELWLVDKTVLPIENSLGGSIHRNYDLHLRHKLHIVGAVQLAVNLCLLALPGVWTQHLKCVLSHPQALAQSDIILSKLGATRENVNDTASAAQLVASNELRDAGAVASARAAEIYGLDILAKRIQKLLVFHDLSRMTLIILLAIWYLQGILSFQVLISPLSIVFTLEEGPGVLFKALATFALRDINLTKIESWPQRKHPLREVDNPNNGSAKLLERPLLLEQVSAMVKTNLPKTIYITMKAKPFYLIVLDHP
ncbi:unnamed protein product [Camellia sinensis]